MRVKLGDRIHFCTLATSTEDSNLVLLTTKNGVYVVNMESVKRAKECHEQLLTLGYYDFSNYEYSN